MLVFGLASGMKRFLLILWIFWWHNGLQMIKSLNSLQFYGKKRCSKTVRLFAQVVIHKVMNLAPSLLVNDWAVRGCSFDTLSWPSPVSNEPLHLCNVPNRCFFFSIPQLSQYFLNVNMLQASNSKWVNICKETKFISLNFEYLVLFLLCNSTEYLLKSVCKSLCSVLFTFHIMPNFQWNWGLYKWFYSTFFILAVVLPKTCKHTLMCTFGGVTL